MSLHLIISLVALALSFTSVVLVVVGQRRTRREYEFTGSLNTRAQPTTVGELTVDVKLDTADLGVELGEAVRATVRREVEALVAARSFALVPAATDGDEPVFHVTRLSDTESNVTGPIRREADGSFTARPRQPEGR